MRRRHLPPGDRDRFRDLYLVKKWMRRNSPHPFFLSKSDQATVFGSLNPSNLKNGVAGARKYRAPANLGLPLGRRHLPPGDRDRFRDLYFVKKWMRRNSPRPFFLRNPQGQRTDRLPEQRRSPLNEEETSPSWGQGSLSRPVSCQKMDAPKFAASIFPL